MNYNKTINYNNKNNTATYDVLNKVYNTPYQTPQSSVPSGYGASNSSIGISNQKREDRINAIKNFLTGEAGGAFNYNADKSNIVKNYVAPAYSGSYSPSVTHTIPTSYAIPTGLLANILGTGIGGGSVSKLLNPTPAKTTTPTKTTTSAKKATTTAKKTTTTANKTTTPAKTVRTQATNTVAKKQATARRTYTAAEKKAMGY